MKEWTTPLNGILTNDWLNFVMTQYGYFIAWLVAVVYAWVKVLAVRNPKVENDGILDLIKVIFTKPGTVTTTSAITETHTESTTKRTTEPEPTKTEDEKKEVQ